MKNLAVWIILISTAAVGVAVAQPSGDELAAMSSSHIDRGHVAA